MILLFLLACGHAMDCDETSAYLAHDGDYDDDIEANAEKHGSDLNVQDCTDTDPDVVDVTHEWWQVCGDYYDAMQELEECCPNGIGYPYGEGICA